MRERLANTMFKYCIPKVAGRGAGLGNELIPWAKAFIAGSELGIPFSQPAWGLNRLRYWEYFGTSRFDWAGHYLIGKSLPSFTFTEEDYFATGEKDFGRAIRVFADANDLKSKPAYVLWVEGMWGGYYAIEKAKPFISSVLYGAKNSVANLWDTKQHLRPDTLVVAVHVRLGDFNAATDTSDYRGKFNVSIPMSWYVSVSRALRKAFGESVQFVLLSNGKHLELRDYIAEFEPVTTSHQNYTVCSDLLTMANADLLICSVSSYSMWAAFLSEKPYFWYEPNLQSHERCFSLWGHEARQAAVNGVTASNISHLATTALIPENEATLSRGIPISENADIPVEILKYLDAKLKLKATRSDLIQYGVVPKNLKHASALKLVN